MSNNKIVFNKETLYFPIILGFTVSLCALFISISLFKSNYSFFNYDNIYWKEKVSLIINMRTEIDTEKFFDNLNEMDFKYLSKDNIYQRNIRNINYVKGIHDVNLENVIPLYSGEFFSEDEINSNENIVLVGNNLKNYTYEKSDTTYIDIFEKSYKVKGYIGRETGSKYSIYLLMPIKSFVDVFNENISSQYNIEVDKKEYENIMGKLNNYYGDDIVDINFSFAESSNSIKKAFDFEKNILINLGISLIFSIVCSITFILIWIEKISKNIAIRRAIGANNKHIFKFMFKSLLLMCGISIFISLSLFIIFLSMFQGLTTFPIIIDIKVVLYSIIVIILLVILLCIYIVKKYSKLNITSLLRS